MLLTSLSGPVLLPIAQRPISAHVPDMNTIASISPFHIPGHVQAGMYMYLPVDWHVLHAVPPPVFRVLCRHLHKR